METRDACFLSSASLSLISFYSIFFVWVLNEPDYTLTRAQIYFVAIATHIRTHTHRHSSAHIYTTLNSLVLVCVYALLHFF